VDERFEWQWTFVASNKDHCSSTPHHFPLDDRMGTILDRRSENVVKNWQKENHKHFQKGNCERKNLKEASPQQISV
jgi:hypothetical protein